MIRAATNRPMLLVVLVGLAALALSVGPTVASDPAALASHGSAALTGLGFWDTLACIGCIAGFVAGAGTTLAGFAVFLAANPELGILCVSSCAAAL